MHHYAQLQYDEEDDDTDVGVSTAQVAMLLLEYHPVTKDSSSKQNVSGVISSSPLSSTMPCLLANVSAAGTSLVSHITTVDAHTRATYDSGTAAGRAQQIIQPNEHNAQPYFRMPPIASPLHYACHNNMLLQQHCVSSPPEIIPAVRFSSPLLDGVRSLFLNEAAAGNASRHSLLKHDDICSTPRDDDAGLVCDTARGHGLMDALFVASARNQPNDDGYNSLVCALECTSSLLQSAIFVDLLAGTTCTLLGSEGDATMFPLHQPNIQDGALLLQLNPNVSIDFNNNRTILLPPLPEVEPKATCSTTSTQTSGNDWQHDTDVICKLTNRFEEEKDHILQKHKKVHIKCLLETYCL
jgi:hypothetical protein